MSELLFEWDEVKNQSNIQKHSISFAEAVTAFEDENAIFIEDATHSGNEERFILLGLSRKNNMIVICHCYRQRDSVIRLISARTANKREEKQYYEK